MLQSIPWNIPALLRSCWQMMIGPALVVVLLLIGAVVISNPWSMWIVGQGFYFLIAMLYLLFD
ncbi:MULTISPECIES: hypothetical protein [Gracilibacillus]|uniref:hypothetical protein n=1 Tax=Gracilibacillus TaxID=74385 RepID=UPI000824DFB7|nr:MULTISPECIES: hypothetical protein [Gracilibacillus]